MHKASFHACAYLAQKGCFVTRGIIFPGNGKTARTCLLKLIRGIIHETRPLSAACWNTWRLRGPRKRKIKRESAAPRYAALSGLRWPAFLAFLAGRWLQVALLAACNMLSLSLSFPPTWSLRANAPLCAAHVLPRAGRCAHYLRRTVNNRKARPRRGLETDARIAADRVRLADRDQWSDSTRENAAELAAALATVGRDGSFPRSAKFLRSRGRAPICHCRRQRVDSKSSAFPAALSRRIMEISSRACACLIGWSSLFIYALIRTAESAPQRREHPVRLRRTPRVYQTCKSAAWDFDRH